MEKLQGWCPREDTRSHPGQTQLVPVDPALVGVDFTSDPSAASVTTHLRKGKKYCAVAVKHEWENMSREQGRLGGRQSRQQSRDSPAACGEDQGEAVCAPTAHGGPHQRPARKHHSGKYHSTSAIFYIALLNIG